MSADHMMAAGAGSRVGGGVNDTDGEAGVSSQTPDAIVVDARALQDSNYRLRGVGQHSSAVLRALRKHRWAGRRPLLVALFDGALEPLSPSHRLLFDRVVEMRRTVPEHGRRRWFLCLSPMTHDPVWAASFLQDPAIYKAALFYDLIPLQIPGRYLAKPGLRGDYLVALAWLRCYDCFASISRFSANALITRLAVPERKVFVSGVAVRSTLEPDPLAEPLPFAERNCIVVAGGGDPRKNPECAIVAHARSEVLHEAGIGLRIFGAYPDAMRQSFRDLYASHGGRQQDLQFLDHLSDHDLHALYRRSKLTVVASRAEGFSIPIVEGNAAGAPVVVSDVGAHPELVPDAEWRFGPDDTSRLQQMLEVLATDEGRWRQLLELQRGLWTRYTEDAVGTRFIEGLLETAPTLPAVDAAAERERAAPAVLRKARPSIAVLSPLPPALSGVADYTAATLRPLKTVVDLHMFTATGDAGWEEGWAGLASISAAMLSRRRFDATVCVMGNSYHHRQVHDYLMQRGGACIAHDARQIDYYFHEFGAQAAVDVAARELRREVTVDELSNWMRNQRGLPTLFLSELAAAADPLIVHSGTTAKEIERLYGKVPVLLPFAQYTAFGADDFGGAARAAARKRLGLGDNKVVLVTFGIVSNDKAPQEILYALSLLRRWGVDAHLVFGGLTPPYMQTAIDDIAGPLDLMSHVRTYDKPIEPETYRDCLLAADVGIQLRTYFMGGLSGALNDCIAAALPSVANEHLAHAMGAPGFVRRVPDGLSSLLIGEAVLDILASGHHLKRPVDTARDFARDHSPWAYCRGLLAALGLDPELVAPAPSLYAAGAAGIVTVQHSPAGTVPPPAIAADPAVPTRVETPA